MKYVIPFLVLASPALADFKVPDGCEAFMTLQQRSCVVTHYYTCEGDPAGHKWRADVGGDGPFFLSQTDAEAQWIRTIDFSQGTEDNLQPDAADPASFTELADTGLDAFDFQTKDNTGKVTRYSGFDTLTGKEVVIDGVRLLETNNQAKATLLPSGEIQWQAEGQEYISPKHRLFFSGVTKWKDSNGEDTYDQSPVEFSFPGDRGFLADKPLYDCNVMNAKF